MSVEPMVAADPASIAADVAETVLAPTASAHDRAGSFPTASVAALARVRLLHAALPTRHGGRGLDAATLVRVARALGRGCGSTAMIWAMHQVQLACVARHGGDRAPLAGLLADCVTHDRLVASVTSERGVGGDLRRSAASCRWDGERVHLTKHATTVSYLRQAGAFLVTARRTADSPPGDQVVLLATGEQSEVDDVGGWDTMGMRATSGPPCRLTVDVAAGQVLPVPFGTVAAATMVPLSHLLWSAVWLGIADEALARATRHLRAKRTTDARLAGAGQRRSMVEALLAAVVARYDRLAGAEAPANLVVELNHLKVAASVQTVRIAEAALEICGVAGYREDGDESVARLLRDLYSARLMVANDRLVTTTATTMLLNSHD